MTSFPNYLDEPADDDFLSGEGPAECGARIRCPYCGILNDLNLDLGSGCSHEYVQDCEVCCQPWTVSVLYRGDGTAEVSIVPLDE